MISQSVVESKFLISNCKSYCILEISIELLVLNFAVTVGRKSKTEDLFDFRNRLEFRRRNLVQISLNAAYVYSVLPSSSALSRQTYERNMGEEFFFIIVYISQK